MYLNTFQCIWPQVWKGREHQVGLILLERYGMTEIGMALTKLLEGERTPGRSHTVREIRHDRNRHGSHQSIRRGENTR